MQVFNYTGVGTHNPLLFKGQLYYQASYPRSHRAEWLAAQVKMPKSHGLLNQFQKSEWEARGAYRMGCKQCCTSWILGSYVLPVFATDNVVSRTVGKVWSRERKDRVPGASCSFWRRTRQVHWSVASACSLACLMILFGRGHEAPLPKGITSEWLTKTSWVLNALCSMSYVFCMCLIYLVPLEFWVPLCLPYFICSSLFIYSKHISSIPYFLYSTIE